MTGPRPSGGDEGVTDVPLEAALQQLHSDELSGVVRYLHYAHMVFGVHRIPVVAWLRARAAEAMDHAFRIGEKMTALGMHPDMRVVPVPETGKHSVVEILREALDFEHRALDDYRALLRWVRRTLPYDVALEDWVREFITLGTAHVEDAEKMLRTM